MKLNKLQFTFVTGFLLVFLSCQKKQEEVSYMNHNCGAQPPFVKSIGFDLTRAGFSTSDQRKMGLHFVQFFPNSTVPEKMYQDSTWKQAGWMGAIVTDKFANVWCTSAPLVNVLNNPLSQQNNLYRVLPQTGKLEMYMRLPGIDTANKENPYGLMGLAFNCEANVLYVSSIAGSTRKNQKGKIFCIDIQSKKIKDTYESIDAFGLAVSFKDGYRKLYVGSARNSHVYSIPINGDGTFNGNAKLAFSVAGLGPRGDDKVKKIREDKQGNLLITAYEFNYNLTAPHEKQESLFTFKYDFSQNKWVNL